MCPSRRVRGCQLNDCNATLWYTERVGAAAKGLSKSKGNCSATRPVISRNLLRQVVRSFPVRDEFRAKFDATLMKASEPTEDMSGVIPADSHSLLGLVRGRLALRLHRRKTYGIRCNPHARPFL